MSDNIKKGVIDFRYKGFPVKLEWVNESLDYRIVFADKEEEIFKPMIDCLENIINKVEK